jgi:hypothetical protein
MKSSAALCVFMCVSPCFQAWKQLTNFCETWHKHYAIGVHPNVVLFDFLQSAITAWQMYELVREYQHLIQNSENMCGNMSSKNATFVKVIFLQNLR